MWSSSSPRATPRSAAVPVPVVIAAVLILAFMLVLKDRTLAPEDKPAWSFREFASAFYINPRKAPDFTWAFVSRFLFVLGQSFLLTYQAFYMLGKLGVTEEQLPDEIFIATLVSSVSWIVASLISGRLSDASGRRKVFALVSLPSTESACSSWPVPRK